MVASKVLRAASLLALGMAALGPRLAGAETLTLAEVEARAQRDRPELAERRASIDKANADRAAAAAKGGPTLAARGELTLAPGAQLLEIDQGNETYFVSGSRAFGQGGALTPLPRYAVVLSGKYTLLDFGRTSLGVRAAEASVLAERASLVQAKIELVRAARTAYLDWIEAHQTWQLAQRDAEVTSARTASVRELILEGARPATDATLSAYDEQLARLRQARARRASLLAYDSLAAALQSDLPRDAVPQLEVIEPDTSGPMLNAAATGGAAAGGAAAGGAAAGGVAAPGAGSGAPAPGVEAASRAGRDGAASAQGVGFDQALDVLDRQRDAALSAARAAGRWRAPQVELGAEVGASGIDEQIFPAYRVGLAINVPIFDGGALSASADQYRAEARGLEAHRARLAKEIAAARRAAETALASAGEELAMSLELLATAEALLTEAEDHYRSGSDTLERVLSAQRSLVQARREVLASKLDTARARLDLQPVQLRD